MTTGFSSPVVELSKKRNKRRTRWLVSFFFNKKCVITKYIEIQRYRSYKPWLKIVFFFFSLSFIVDFKTRKITPRRELFCEPLDPTI